MVSNKGFTLIGVLVAGVIGLIVVYGLAKSFAHHANSLKGLEQSLQRAIFKERFNKLLNDKDACKATLNQDITSTQKLIDKIKNPSGSAPFTTIFSRIYKADGSEWLEGKLPTSSSPNTAERKKLRNYYGIEGLLFYRLSCLESPTTPARCKADGATWGIDFISQTKVVGIPRMNALISFPFKIKYSGSDFDCDLTGSSTPTPTPPSMPAFNADCPAGQVLQRVQSDGTTITKTCVPQASLSLSVNCPTGQVLKGFDQSGAKTCITPPSTPKNVSCGTGEVLKGFDSSGNKICVAQSTLSLAVDCPAGKALKSFDQSGAKTCVSAGGVTQRYISTQNCQSSGFKTCLPQLGTYSFCVLSGVSFFGLGSNGLNKSFCRVSGAMNGAWLMNMRVERGTLSCTATCFD